MMSLSTIMICIYINYSFNPSPSPIPSLSPVSIIMHCIWLLSDWILIGSLLDCNLCLEYEDDPSLYDVPDQDAAPDTLQLEQGKQPFLTGLDQPYFSVLCHDGSGDNADEGLPVLSTFVMGIGLLFN